MATTKKDAAPENTDAAGTKPENADVDRAGTGPDRVAMVSLRADGTPDQTPGYETIVDEPDPRLAPLDVADETDDTDKA